MVDKKNKNKPVDKPDPGIKTTTEPEEKKAGRIFKILIIGIVVVLLGSVGFAAGVYLKLIDIQKIVDTYKLNDYSFVAKYYPKQQTNFEPVEIEQSAESAKSEVQMVTAPLVQPIQQTPEPPKPPVDPVEQEKQNKAKQQEEAKRLSKMARLYGGMKADEAVSVLNQLDDDLVIAILGKMEEEQVTKILVAMDAKKAARLTQTMLKGKPQ